jgi:hypothetical protein
MLEESQLAEGPKHAPDLGERASDVRPTAQGE